MASPHRCSLVDDRVALKQQVKDANDIVAVVGEYVTLRPVGPTFKGLCPFHKDSRPSLDVDPARQRYRCWACNKYGDVISFVQEFTRVTFREALELLARRAGISLESQSFSKHGPSRARMLDVLRWAAQQFQKCLLDDPAAENARKYLGERKLTGETVRGFGLGFAPAAGNWLLQQAGEASQSLELLEQVGLIAKRDDGSGHYGRFRDRVIFPIRDSRGDTVGFGGRILPSSPLSAQVAKYYNSSDTAIFKKSDQLYGIDRARQAAADVGYLAVVEGYTDVLMAHQMGIPQVIATMGTALNERHVKKLRSFAQRVVLVFDADAGGDTGVDRALEVFVRQEVDLRVASLPEGLDPCDLLVKDGPEPFRRALESAVDVFEYKLQQVWQQAGEGVEAKSRAVSQMLGVLALSPELRTVKMELMVNRIAHRLSLKEETLWNRLRALHASRKQDPEEIRGADPRHTETRPAELQPTEPSQPRTRAAMREVELLEVLLAEPELVGLARAEIDPSRIEHPEIRLLIEGLYRLQAEGLPPDLDHLRGRLDNEVLLAKAFNRQQRGLDISRRGERFQEILARFRERDRERQTRELHNQLHSANDHDTAMDLLRKWQAEQIAKQESHGNRPDDSPPSGANGGPKVG